MGRSHCRYDMGDYEVINTIKIWLKMMLYENNKLSMTNFMIFVSFVSFIFVSLFLLITQRQFAYYSEFSAFTAGGGMAAKFGNKFVNSKFNSPVGEPPNLYKKEG